MGVPYTKASIRLGKTIVVSAFAGVLAVILGLYLGLRSIPELWRELK